jgi:hypothetical protein
LPITDLHRAKSLDGAAFSQLDAIEEARRDTSIDESRRSDPDLLISAVARSLQRGGIVLSDVGMVIADTGARANRVFELIGQV